EGPARRFRSHSPRFHANRRATQSDAVAIVFTLITRLKCRSPYPEEDDAMLENDVNGLAELDEDILTFDVTDDALERVAPDADRRIITLAYCTKDPLSCRLHRVSSNCRRRAYVRSLFPFLLRPSGALPVGHAFSDKFSSVSFCNVLLPCLCDALLPILPTQHRSAQGCRSGC